MAACFNSDSIFIVNIHNKMKDEFMGKKHLFDFDKIKVC
jgi:hypothetical protein